MWTPTMNCWGDYPDWNVEWWPWWISHPQKPEICEECEFYSICFMNRTAHLLWFPMDLSVDAMTKIVNLQRLQESWADDEVIWAYANYISNTHD